MGKVLAFRPSSQAASSQTSRELLGEENACAAQDDHDDNILELSKMCRQGILEQAEEHILSAARLLLNGDEDAQRIAWILEDTADLLASRSKQNIG